MHNLKYVLILALLFGTTISYSQKHQIVTDGGYMLVVRPANKVPLYVKNYKFDIGYQYNSQIDDINSLYLNPSIGYIETNTVRTVRNNYISLGLGWGTYHQWYNEVRGYYLWNTDEFAFSVKTKLYFTDVKSKRFNFGISGEIGNLLSQGYFFIPTFVFSANLIE